MAAGKGLFVGWYDTDPVFQPEWDRWHSEEHMPERVALPGFLTAQRYAAVDKRWHYCVLYRALDVRTLVSEPYLKVLNNPTEWTRKMMPGIRNLNRTLCSIVREAGSGFGSTLHTIQFSPDVSSAPAFLEWIDGEGIESFLSVPGVVRITLASADKEISLARTQEQTLRAQPDAVSDGVLLIEGYSDPALARVSRLASEALVSHGGCSLVAETFRLGHLLVSPRGGGAISDAAG